MSQLILISGRDAALRERIFAAISAPGRSLLETTGGATLEELAGVEAPDLLILDAETPAAGLAAVRAIRARHLQVRMLLLVDSGAAEGIASSAASVGVQAVLPRPVDLGVLVAQVDRALDEALAKLGLTFEID